MDPQGSIATILDDDNMLYDRIDDSLEELNGTIQELKQFVGFVNSSQPQIAGILEEGRSVLGDGNANHLVVPPSFFWKFT